MKLFLKAVRMIGHVVTSCWFVIALLLALAASLLWRGIFPGPSKLEKLAWEIDDSNFHNWFPTIRTAMDSAAANSTIDK